MTEEIAHMGLAIDSRQVVSASRHLNEFDRAADGAERSVKNLETAAGLLSKAMGILGAALGVQQLIRLTSVWTDLNSRLRNAVGSHEAAADAMSRITEMARRTYSSTEQTAESFLRNAAALTALGYATSEQLDMTEALNNALVISATRGEAAESVMTAWSRAMALGKLSGDQLETVMASGGRVAQALAESMGVSVLELRKLGQEGKITGDKMMGITSQLEKLREEADRMPATISDAFVLLGNSLLEMVGRLDQATGASAATAEAIILIADNADILIPIVGGLAGIVGTLLVPSLVSATAAMVAFAASPVGLLTIGIGALAAAITHLWNQQRLADEAMKTHTGAVDANAKALDGSKDASGRYTQALRDQVAMQVEAAKAAMLLADAEWQAAIARRDAFRAMTGMTFAPFEYDATARLAEVTALDQAYTKLQMQLAQIDAAGVSAPSRTGVPSITDPKAAKAAEQAMKMLQEQGRQLTMDLKGPFEVMQFELDNLGALLNARAIDWDTFAEASLRAKATAVGSMADMASGIMGSLSGLFEGNKSFALATAVVDGISAVAKAFSAYPPPFNFAAAAAAAVGAAANVAAIASTTKDTKSMPATAGSSGAGATTGGAGAPTAQQPQQAVNFYFHGSQSALIRILLDELAEGINTSDHGDKFNAAVRNIAA